MSNFQTFGRVTDGQEGSAPAKHLASTTDSLATMLAAGYLNDKAKNIKPNDRIAVNYLDASVFPLNTGESALYQDFYVQYDPALNNWNMVPLNPPAAGIGAYGVHSANYDYAGGSATFVISDAAITPNSVVIGRFQSQANAALVKTVLPGNGQITVVASADPGVSVFGYMSVLPSPALQGAGVYAAQYSNAGGSATITIANPNIAAGMIVNANFASQANAAEIKTVIASAGAITIVATADPGVSVVEWVAFAASSSLTALGMYGASYSNAGGSATTTISDSNIKASSIVTADWASQANAVEIDKIVVTAGQIVVTSSGDPGVSVLNYMANPSPEGAAAGTFLVAANNLSDVASASASIANLGGLALAGGQMTGQLLLDRGTATSTAGAATINHQAGVVTTEALTTSSGSAYSFTLTNSRILATSIVLCQLLGGTNTKHGLSFTAVPGSGSAAISVLNNDISAAALNGTLIFGFVVI